MIHHGQRLALGLESRNDLIRIHPGLDQFQRNSAFDRLYLLRHVDGSHAAFAQPFEQFVGADHGVGRNVDRFLRCSVSETRLCGAELFDSLVQRAGRGLVKGCEQALDLRAELCVFPTGFLKIRPAFVGIR